MGRKGIRGLKTRVGGSSALAVGDRLYSGGIHVGGIRGGSHSVTSGDTAGGAAPRALNLEGESCEHFRWTHLEQMQHCPARSHFQRTLSKRRWGQCWDERYRSLREGQEKRERENKRPILNKLCDALPRSFRGQHSEKMKGSARGNWNLREGQQPF